MPGNRSFFLSGYYSRFSDEEQDLNPKFVVERKINFCYNLVMVNNILGTWEGEAPAERPLRGSAGASPSQNSGAQHVLDHYTTTRYLPVKSPRPTRNW